MASRTHSGSSFSGSLVAKKKAELQEIAQALRISDAGTREELQQRINQHLDENSSRLEEHPAFSGLFNSRRKGRGSQPPEPLLNASRDTRRLRMGALKEIREDSPPVDIRNVSMMLPSAPISPPGFKAHTPDESTPSRTAHTPDPTTPSSLPPLPPSPAKSLIADAMAQPEVQAVVEMERSFVRNLSLGLTQTRAFLSSSKNIFIITTLFDLVAILAVIHQDSPFPIPPITVDIPPALHVMSLAATHWAIPSVFLPLILGYLISFVPGSAPKPSFDPLTASIVRVAANIAYRFPLVRLTDITGQPSSDSLHELDILGARWRVLNASVTLAFALSEAIRGHANQSTPEESITSDTALD